MSRSGGYKCYNSRCSSCLGKTLCTEPGDTALSCQDRVVDEKSEINYKTQAKVLTLVAQFFEGIGIPETYVKKVYNAAESITDLLARAEAAEAAQETLQRAVEEYKARAEKAEERANRWEEEVKAYSESDLAKAHDLLSADWAKQKIRADAEEARAEKAERERDAAVKDLEKAMEFDYADNVFSYLCSICENHRYDGRCKLINGDCKPKWRGQKEE